MFSIASKISVGILIPILVVLIVITCEMKYDVTIAYETIFRVFHIHKYRK